VAADEFILVRSENMGVYLYDPRTNITTETNYELLADITGNSISSLQSMKSKKRKIRKINCYLIDEKVTIQQRRAWYENENYMGETWLEIKGSGGKYLISSYGRVKRVCKDKEKLLLPYLKKSEGLLEIKVLFNGIHQRCKVGRLVAEHFIGPSKEGYVLVHSNGIKTDDHCSNLKYIIKSQMGKKYGGNSRSKPVVQLHPDTREVIGEFRSAREAGRECYLSYQAVTDNCNYKSKKSGGYIFMWESEYKRLLGQFSEIV